MGPNLVSKLGYFNGYFIPPALAYVRSGGRRYEIGKTCSDVA